MRSLFSPIMENSVEQVNPLLLVILQKKKKKSTKKAHFPFICNFEKCVILAVKKWLIVLG